MSGFSRRCAAKLMAPARSLPGLIINGFVRPRKLKAALGQKKRLGGRKKEDVKSVTGGGDSESFYNPRLLLLVRCELHVPCWQAESDALSPCSIRPDHTTVVRVRASPNLRGREIFRSPCIWAWSAENSAVLTTYPPLIAWSATRVSLPCQQNWLPCDWPTARWGSVSSHGL